MSTVLGPARRDSPARPRHPARWIAIVALSVLIHLALIDALPNWTIEPGDDDTLGEPLRATLAPLVRPPEQPQLPQRQTTTPAPRTAKPHPSPEARGPDRDKPITAVEEPTFVPDGLEAPQAVAVAPDGPVAAPPVEASPPVPPAPRPAPTTPPQSARLDYAVISQNVKEPNPIYGRGTITWATSGDRYASDLKAAADVLLFRLDVLSSHSEGAIGPGGVMPDRYLESPRKRATVATNFNRDTRQSITFSASPASVPLPAGAQDRLSVLFQIGALLLADPRETTPGTAIEIPVAGVRDVEPWRFDVVGSETLDTGVGSLSTTHLRRAPRPGTNDRTIDVWVAQSNGGYPARVLYTEPSGSTVMMTLDRITALPP